MKDQAKAEANHHVRLRIQHQTSFELHWLLMYTTTLHRFYLYRPQDFMRFDVAHCSMHVPSNVAICAAARRLAIRK
jgi:hypothetical protein